MIRYYINNFTDGYNTDCLDLSQGRLGWQTYDKSLGFLTPIKIAFGAVFTTLIMTYFFLNTYFPYPKEQTDDSCSLCVFRTLVYFGVFMVGMLGIQYNGRLFIDDCRLQDN